MYLDFKSIITIFLGFFVIIALHWHLGITVTTSFLAFFQREMLFLFHSAVASHHQHYGFPPVRKRLTKKVTHEKLIKARERSIAIINGSITF